MYLSFHKKKHDNATLTGTFRCEHFEVDTKINLAVITILCGKICTKA